MAREALSERDRTIVAACAIGVVAFAFASELLWRHALGSQTFSGLATASWIRSVSVAVPVCLALAALVLSGRAGIGVAIAATGATATVLAGILQFTGLGLGPTDYISWWGGSLIGACALLPADVLVWRFGSRTPLLGALAGASAAVTAVVLVVYLAAIGGNWDVLPRIPVQDWLTSYVAPGVLLVLTGAVAGAISQRRGTRQETAARG